METVNVAPSVDGLLRYFRHLYGIDRTRALRLFEAAWPTVGLYASAVIEGSLSLEAAFAANSLDVKNRFFGDAGSKHNLVDRGESGIEYAVLPPTLSDADVRAIWASTGRSVYAERCGCSHDCCAHRFTGSLRIRRDARRVVVTQSWGINI